jgi:hypothetical protein
MDKPADYRIVVEGELHESWSERLAGMRLHVGQSKQGQATTTLEGSLRDQAALSGVLNTLYELHLVVLSVLRLKPDGTWDEHTMAD